MRSRYRELEQARENALVAKELGVKNLKDVPLGVRNAIRLRLGLKLPKLARRRLQKQREQDAREPEPVSKVRKLDPVAYAEGVIRYLDE